MPDAFAVSKALREAYFRYYDTPFALSDRALQDERRALLDAEGVSWRDPWIDLLREYETVDEDLGSAFASAGAHSALSDFSRLGLLAGIPSIYRHQYDDPTASRLQTSMSRSPPGQDRERPRPVPSGPERPAQGVVALGSRHHDPRAVVGRQRSLLPSAKSR